MHTSHAFSPGVPSFFVEYKQRFYASMLPCEVVINECFPIEGVADKLAKYFSGHLAALWHAFGCNFMESMHLKLPEKVSRHLVVFSVGRVTSKTKTFIKNRKINYTSCMPIYIMSLLSESVTQTTVIANM